MSKRDRFDCRAALAAVFLLAFGARVFAAGAPNDTSSGEMPKIDQLPAVKELPDPFTFRDGSKVRTKQDWDRRRHELLELVQYYEYGHLPPEGAGATKVVAQEIWSRGGASRDPFAEKRILLGVGPEGKVQVPLDLTIPKGKGPFPVIIKGDLCWGKVKEPIVQEILKRGYVLAEFDRTYVASDSANKSKGIYSSYPESDGAALAMWAWGFHRVADYLLTQDFIDKEKIVVTGHSRGGKAALLAGATDERVTLTVPNGSGAGGAGCFRLTPADAESLERIQTSFPYWFVPRFKEFIGHVDQLPFDQHEVKALVAPRALLSTEGLGDVWANPSGTQQTYLAAKEVYKFLGAPEKIGIHFRPGKHEQGEEDWKALLDFADWQLRGKQPAQAFDKLAFPEQEKHYSWGAPRGERK